MVLTNLKDEMFFHRSGSTIFEKSVSEYFPLEDWQLNMTGRSAVIELLEEDGKFSIVDNENEGAELFVEHVRWEATNFFKLSENAERVRAYCAEQDSEYLLLVQPGLVYKPAVAITANRGFGILQTGLLGQKVKTLIGYSSTVLLYECESGKEIEGLNRHAWNELEYPEWIEFPETGSLAEVEQRKDEFRSAYLAFVVETVNQLDILAD